MTLVRELDSIQCDNWGSKSIRPEFFRSGIDCGAGDDMEKQPMETAVEQQRQNGWDLKELMERLDDDQEFLCELLVMFREDVRTNLEKTRKAIGTGDYEGLSRIAHTMKGMLKNLSMGAAAETAAALELVSRDNQECDSRELLEKLVKELERILPEVEAQLAGVRL